MASANDHRNDDWNDDTAALDRIDPAALRAARERRGLSQLRLAEAIGCGKATVSRWERGRSRRVQPRHRDLLCAALGVGWAALADAASDGPDDVSRDSWIGSAAGEDIRSAFRLAAERYGVGVGDVIEAAPLLFVAAAERSLAERRRQLDAARAEVDRAGRALADNAPHLGRAVAEAVRKEETSIAQNDISGRLVRPEGYGEDDEGPFARFLRDLAGDLPESARHGFVPAPEKGDDSPGAPDDARREPAEAPDENRVRRRVSPHFEAGRIDSLAYLEVEHGHDAAACRHLPSDAPARTNEEMRAAAFAGMVSRV